MGWHKPVWSRTVLGGTVHAVMRHAPADVAVLVDRGLTWPPRRILVAFAGSEQDAVAVRLASLVARRCRAALTLLRVVRRGATEVAPLPELPASVSIVEAAAPVDAVIAEARHHELTVLGVGDDWQLRPHAFGLRSERLAAECSSSLLVVRGLRDKVPA
jgi:nucleotide-binding universal stress UspA family protein